MFSPPYSIFERPSSDQPGLQNLVGTSLDPHHGIVTEHIVTEHCSQKQLLALIRKHWGSKNISGKAKYVAFTSVILGCTRLCSGALRNKVISFVISWLYYKNIYTCSWCSLYTFLRLYAFILLWKKNVSFCLILLSVMGRIHAFWDLPVKSSCPNFLAN